MYKNPLNKFKTLSRLIDQAILPATILIAAKILSLILLNEKFNLDWQVGTSGIIYSSKQDFIFANSYSSLFMYLAISVGLILLIIKATRWHATHIKPSLAAKFHEKNLDFLITDSVDIYVKSTIWISYAWLTTALMFIQNFYGLLIPWVSYTALSMSIIFTVLIIMDVEKEINVKSNKPSLKDSNIYLSDLAQVLKNT